MATATATARRGQQVKEYNFLWEGRDKTGKLVKGDMRAGGKHVVLAALRRQGISKGKVRRQRGGLGGTVSEKDVTFFTRQMATMMKAGVPLLQAFDIVGKGHANPAVAKLLMDIKADVETGTSLSAAFRKHPLHFDALFCNLVGAGESAGILDSLWIASRPTRKRFLRSRARSSLLCSIQFRSSWSRSSSPRSS